MKWLLLNKRGQSTLEYVIIWTSVVAAIYSAANEYLKPSVESVVENASHKIKTEVENLLNGIGQ